MWGSSSPASDSVAAGGHRRAWAHRRMLLTAGDRLSPRQFARFGRVPEADVPTEESGAPGAASPGPVGHSRPEVAVLRRLRRRRHAETTRLANTVETWWPQILVFLQLRVTNAHPRGSTGSSSRSSVSAAGFNPPDRSQPWRARARGILGRPSGSADPDGATRAIDLPRLSGPGRRSRAVLCQSPVGPHP